jgi:hypothetical protein
MKLRVRHILLAPRSAELPALLATIGFGSVAILFYLMLWHMGVRPTQLSHETIRPLLFVLLGCAAYYGAARASCHPVFNLQYLKWLATTPWRAPMALPTDPLHPVWQDGAQIAILAALSVLVCRTHPALPIIALAGGYLILLTRALLVTGQSVIAVTLIALLPITWHLWGCWWIVLSLLIVMCLLALLGVRRSWSAFPWGMDQRQILSRNDRVRLRQLGWPFDRLNAFNPSDVNKRVWVLGSVIAGWYVFTFCRCLADPEIRRPNVAAMSIATLGCLVAFARFISYCLMRAPPMSLLSRVVTGHLILPGYDRVLVAPVAIGVVSIVGSILLYDMHLDPPLSVGVMTTIVLILCFCLPPTLRHWQLTGQYRMVIFRPRSSR